jgi:uncharacterized protein DUF5684
VNLLSSGSGMVLIIYLIVIAAYVVGMWKVFTKAGQPGWASIIPIYNAYVMLKIVGRPGWWLILYFIPLVNIIIWIIVSLDLAKVFNQGSGFGVGIILLPFIFVPVLGFGDARYVGGGGQPVMA